MPGLCKRALRRFKSFAKRIFKMGPHRKWAGTHQRVPGTCPTQIGCARIVPWWTGEEGRCK